MTPTQMAALDAEQNRLDLIDICLDLHGDLTGSGPDTYAEWNQGVAKRAEHLAYLRKRLDEWTPPTCWEAFDNAVKAVVEATLAEREPKDTP